MLRLLTPVLLALLALVAAPGPQVEAAVQPPNKSIVVYRPGTVTFGTLSNGVFTAKSQRTGTAWREWTNIAVSRDTVLFYNASNGRVRTGLLKAGVFTPVATRTVFAGAAAVVASCNSVLFAPATGTHAGAGLHFDRWTARNDSDRE